MTSPSHKPSRAGKRTMRSDILSVVNMLSYRLNLRLLFLWSIHEDWPTANSFINPVRKMTISIFSV